MYALQTEGERGESGFSSALEIDGSRNITVANMHIYRVISSNQPFPYRDSGRRFRTAFASGTSIPIATARWPTTRRYSTAHAGSNFANANSRGSRLGDTTRSRPHLTPGVTQPASGACGEAGRRVPQHLRRRRRTVWRLLFRGCEMEPDLSLVSAARHDDHRGCTAGAG